MNSNYYSIFLYDWFYTEGTDLLPHLNLTRKEAEEKLFNMFPGSKYENIIEETCRLKSVPGKVVPVKECFKENYWVVYPADLVEGAFLKIERKK